MRIHGESRVPSQVSVIPQSVTGSLPIVIGSARQRRAARCSTSARSAARRPPRARRSRAFGRCSTTTRVPSSSSANLTTTSVGCCGVRARIEVEDQPRGRLPHEHPAELDLVTVAARAPRSGRLASIRISLRGSWRVPDRLRPPVRGALGEQLEGARGGARQKRGLLDHSRASSSSRMSAVSQNSSRNSRTDASPCTRTA